MNKLQKHLKALVHARKKEPCLNVSNKCSKGIELKFN